MPEKIRKSMLARLVAIGFIYLIIMGNIWFGLGLSGDGTPSWMFNGFFAGVAWVIVLSVSLVIQWIYLWQTDGLNSSEEYVVESQP